MSKAQKIVIWSLLFLLFMCAVYLLRDVLLPFVAGISLAYFLDPVTSKVQKKIRSRSIAVAIVFGTFLLICFLAVVIFLPIVEKQFATFISNVPMYANLLWQKSEPYLRELKRLFPAETEDARATLESHLSGAFNLLIKTASRLLNQGVALLNILSLLIITPVVAFYLLRDWDHFCSSILNLLPRNEAPTIRILLGQMNEILSGFIRGQATVCVCLGLFYAIGLSVVGLDLGLLIGLFIGALSFIPYVGSTTGFIVSVALSLVQFDDWRKTLAVVVVFFVGQMLEGYVLTPKLVGEKVGLSPVWVMFALLAGAALFGFLGVLIAVPTAAMIGVLVRFCVQKYKESTLYLGSVHD